MNGDRIYLDTSALLPYYRDEPVSRRVEDFLTSIQPPVLLSDLSRVEIASAIARWQRKGEINEVHAARLEKAVAGDIKAGLLLVQAVTRSHYQRAERWLAARNTPLRTLDALHLACCYAAGAKLVTVDNLMHQSAQILGLESLLLTG
jgi:uncharacterized protein